MDRIGYRRIDALMGLVFVALLGAALLSPGPPPKSDDSIDHIVASLVNAHTILVGGMYLAGLASMAFLWFLGAVRAFVQPSDQENSFLGTVLVAGGVLSIAFTLGGMGMFSGLALNAQSHNDPALVRAFTDTSNVLIGMGKFPYALFVIATCVAARRTSRLPAWIVFLGFASAAIVLVSAFTFFFFTGVFEFGGPVDLVGATLPAIWTAILSVTMFMRAERAS